jgi:4-hydroxy-tetrahydrodipicolinate reductase
VIRVCVAGVTGWTGRPVADAIEAADDLELASGVSRSDPAHFSSVAEALDAKPADVLVDYTHAAAVKANVLAALERSVGVVVGSSGLSGADYDEIDTLAREKRVGVIAAGNFSLTAALLLRAATEAARHLGSWEVIDYASAGKQDAPSGTARELTERLDEVAQPALPVPLDEVHGARDARGATVGHTQVHSLRLPSSSSRPRSCSRPTVSGSRSARTRGRARRPTSPAHCSRSGRYPAGLVSRAGSTDYWAESRSENATVGGQRRRRTSGIARRPEVGIASDA